MLWTSNKPVVMILNGTNSISSDLKFITFNIYHLPPPQVIGKYKIYSFLLVFIQLLFSTRSAWEMVVSVSLPWPQCTICAVKGFAGPRSFCVTINTLKSFFGSKILWIAARLIVLYQLTVSRKPGVEMMTDFAFQCMLWWNEQAKRSMGDLY